MSEATDLLEQLIQLKSIDERGKTTKILWTGEEGEPFVALVDDGKIRIGIKGYLMKDADNKEFQAVASAVQKNPKMSAEDVEDLLHKYDI